MKHIHKCNSCKIYTLKEKCPSCSSSTEVPRPPKYSPTDKYASYRRVVRKKELSDKKLL